jgi:hypothetical protein
MMNENAIANIVVDLDFLEEQFRGAGRVNLVSLFTELRMVSSRSRLVCYWPRTLVLLYIFPSPFFSFLGHLSLLDGRHTGDINRDVRFGYRVPRAIITPNKVRNRQTKETRCAT